MNEEIKIYFQFKPNIRQVHGRPVILRDVIDIFGLEEEFENILDTVLVPPENENPVVIKAMDIIRIIQSSLPNSQIYLVGEGKVLVEYSGPKSAFDSRVFTWIKVGVTAVLSLIGAGLAIMYFHADVNMKEVHSIIFSVITGENGDKPHILSIPYSIGIGVGIAMFFDIFSFGKKKTHPGPLELEIYNYENQVYSYIRDEEEKEDGS